MIPRGGLTILGNALRCDIEGGHPMLRSGLRLFLIPLVVLALGACSGDGDTIGMNQGVDLTEEPGEDTSTGGDGVGEDDTVAGAECGDGICAKEEFETCPEDCAVDPFCGDQYCGDDEDCETCPEDCGECAAGCGDGECKDGETCADCPMDCGDCPALCGDGNCDEGEDCLSCSLDCGDCPPFCGDGECNGEETIENCPLDCDDVGPGECGDGECGDGENPLNCPEDCENIGPGNCGDGECGPGETPNNCPEDCQGGTWDCGDGVCDMGEQFYCPEDCGGEPGECGDGECGDGETAGNCPEDCQGGSNFPTCDTDADCTGGQTCVDIMGFVQLCLSDCETDADCPDSTCETIGAWGYEVGKVCGCADDGDCASDLVCCPIPMMDQSTCLTECMSGPGF